MTDNKVYSAQEQGYYQQLNDPDNSYQNQHPQEIDQNHQYMHVLPAQQFELSSSQDYQLPSNKIQLQARDCHLVVTSGYSNSDPNSVQQPHKIIISASVNKILVSEEQLLEIRQYLEAFIKCEGFVTSCFVIFAIACLGAMIDGFGFNVFGLSTIIKSNVLLLNIFYSLRTIKAISDKNVKAVIRKKRIFEVLFILSSISAIMYLLAIPMPLNWYCLLTRIALAFMFDFIPTFYFVEIIYRLNELEKLVREKTTVPVALHD